MMLLVAWIRAKDNSLTTTEISWDGKKAILRKSSKKHFSFYSAIFAFLETHLDAYLGHLIG